MHELSVATAVLNTALKHAADRPVAVVAMRVGTMRQVVPESLLFYWDIVSRDSICEGAELALTEVTARIECGDCGHAWEPLVPDFRCAACGSADVTVVAGEELEVEHLELREPSELTGAAHA